MARTLAGLAVAAFFLSTLVPAEEGLEDAMLAHDAHPGLGHPEEGEGEHHHGDPDDHHESPDSPCHHHDEHSCCASGTPLGLPGASTSFDAHAAGYLAIPCVEPRLTPTARELFHVPLS